MKKQIEPARAKYNKLIKKLDNSEIDKKIEKDIKNNQTSVKITNVENELLYNYYNQSTWRNFKVIPFSNPEIKTYLPSYKSVYNTYKEVVQRLDSNMYVKETVE